MEFECEHCGKSTRRPTGEGGTFRYLIYNRLGFKQDAYAPLYMSGGMVISNEFDLSKDQDA